MQRTRLHITLSLFVLFIGFHGHAQSSKQYSFKQFSLQNGLVSNGVNRVVQDPQGFMWIATDNGLQRYDGSSFMTFKPKAGDATSIPDSKITLLYVDRAGNLWMMGDNRRIGMFDTRKFTFKEVPIQGNPNPLFILQSFFELSTGELLLLKHDGNFLEYKRRENRFVNNSHILPVPKHWRRTWVYYDENINGFWMTCDSGLVLYDPLTRHVNYRGHNIDRDPVIEAFKDMLNPARVFVDPAGNVMFIHWEKNAGHPLFHRFVRKKGKAEKFDLSGLGYYEADYFLKQRNGRVWVYGRPFFAEWLYNNEPTKFLTVPNVFQNEQSIRFDYMYDTYEDKANNIWLPTDNGLFVFNPDKQIFNTYYFARPGAPPFDAGVQTLRELPDGRVFIGSWGSAGVTCYDKDFNPLPLPPFPYGERSTWDMIVHPKTGELFITMQGGSIVIYDPKKNYFRRVNPELTKGVTIRQVQVDDEGNLWYGMQDGRIIKWDYAGSKGDAQKGYTQILKSGLVYKLYYHKGILWAACLARGLNAINAKTGKIIKTYTISAKKEESLFTDSPTDMIAYDDTTMIVSANCVNVINTKTGKISYIGQEQGLPSNTAISVHKDDNGIVWVGMVNGLCRLNLQKKLITYYDRRDGIADDKFNMGSLRKLSGGRLSLTTDHSFMVFDPEQFSQRQMPPKPVITDMKLAGRSQNLDSLYRNEGAVLNYNNTSFSINFSTLTYSRQNKLLYYYQLEGLDDNWIKTDKPIEVTYNYLPPGNYTFKVKTENTDGLSNPNIAALVIDVRAPFWRTWWFVSFCALLLITVLYLLDKERMKKRRAIHQLRNQIRTNLKEEVSTTLNNINVLSEMAKIKVDKNPEQTKGYIEQIGEKSKRITEVMNDTLWSIDPENDSMLQTLQRIHELCEDQQSLYGIQVEFSAEQKLEHLKPDMKIRHELYLFCKECLSFLLQNEYAEQISLNLRWVKNKLQTEILAETNDDATLIGKELSDHTDKRTAELNGRTEILTDRNKLSLVLLLPIV